MSKYDRLVTKVELFERLAVYGDRKSFLQALAQAPLQLDNTHAPGFDYTQPTPAPAIPPPPPSITNVTTIPEVTIQGHIPVDINIQKMLNELLVTKGDMLPIKEDGDLGKETKNALRLFVKRFHVPATGKNIRNVYKSHNSKPIDLGPVNQKPASTGNELHLGKSETIKPGSIGTPLGGLGNTHKI